jgi:ankyrin repeat protein
MAVRKGGGDLVAALVDAGAEIAAEAPEVAPPPLPSCQNNQQFETGLQPLAIAAASANVEGVSVLLRFGADVLCVGSNLNLT